VRAVRRAVSGACSRCQTASHAPLQTRATAACCSPLQGCKPLGDGKKRCLPKLIIMGQFKCGTTALFDTLAQHPDLLLPHTKVAFEHKCPRQQPQCVIKEANGACGARRGARSVWRVAFRA
jgi:hypothetical protein